MAFAGNTTLQGQRNRGAGFNSRTSFLLPPLTESDFLLQIPEVTGDEYWQKQSGAKKTRQSADWSDGVRKILLPIPGPYKVENLVISKPFWPERDQPIFDWFDNWCVLDNPPPIIVIQQPVRYCNNEPRPNGKPIRYANCYPIELPPPTADKTSSNVAMVELTLAVEDWSFQ
jgi:hypothetical protein